MDTRKTITLNIANLVQQSPAANEFYDEYSNTTSHTIKRGLVDRIVRAGSLMEQCGLTSVVALLDNESFMGSSIDEKREMLAKALELSGISSSMPSNAAKRTRQAKKPDVELPAQETTDQIDVDKRPESEQEQAHDSESGDVSPKRTGVGKMFGGFKNPNS